MGKKSVKGRLLTLFFVGGYGFLNSCGNDAPNGAF